MARQSLFIRRDYKIHHEKKEESTLAPCIHTNSRHYKQLPRPHDSSCGDHRH